MAQGGCGGVRVPGVRAACHDGGDGGSWHDDGAGGLTMVLGASWTKALAMATPVGVASLLGWGRRIPQQCLFWAKTRSISDT